MEPNDILSEKNMQDVQETHESELAEQIQPDHAVTDVQVELEACKAASDQWQQRYMQISADMQNYKRRMEKEQLSWTRRAQEHIFLQILPIVDDFDRALAEQQKHGQAQDLSAWIAGFEMIHKELCKFLQGMHVVQMPEAVVFDPEMHEAIAQIDAPDAESGAIVQVVQKGYMHGEHVLRPAKVVVAQ